jgi:ABC-type Mn2+/Zn2+ transport system ATPase subunit
VSEPSLVLRARRLRAARGVTVASDVALTAAAGEVIAVEGPNGSGKTTLLAAAAGLLPLSRASVRPTTVGYSPERAPQLPRVPVSRWLAGLGRTAGLSRNAASAQTADVLRRLGLEAAAQRPLHVLSRGNAQRALVAQALVGDPDLVILDEPSGGMDADGVARVAAEIERAADRKAVVLVARHPTAPLPLPPGTTWRFEAGQIDAIPRARTPSPAGAASPGSLAGVPALFDVETGDGDARRVTEADLPRVLRTALDAGIGVRRVEPVAVTRSPARGRAPVSAVPPVPASHAPASHAPASHAPVRRAGTIPRLMHGALHRALLLAVSQWFAAPLLLFLTVLAVIYASDAGPPLQSAAVTAIALIPVMMWLTVQAHRVDGRELARAFAVHIGGRARAHLATDLCAVPYGIALTAAAVIVPLVTQVNHHHPHPLVFRMIELHLAAALFGIGLGSALALIDRMGWRLVTGVMVFLALIIVHHTPLTPLMRLSATAVTNVTPVASQVAWLSLPGLALVAIASLAAARVP